MRDLTGYVYILSSKGKRLYIGVTTQLETRVRQHKTKANPDSFTARYNIDRLVYYECFPTIVQAIAREKTFKNMHRLQKIQLIVSRNPDWRDLSAPWGKPAAPFSEDTLRPPTTF